MLVVSPLLVVVGLGCVPLHAPLTGVPLPEGTTGSTEVIGSVGRQLGALGYLVQETPVDIGASQIIALPNDHWELGFTAAIGGHAGLAGGGSVRFFTHRSEQSATALQVNAGLSYAGIGVSHAWRGPAETWWWLAPTLYGAANSYGWHVPVGVTIPLEGTRTLGFEGGLRAGRSTGFSGGADYFVPYASVRVGWRQLKRPTASDASQR